MLTLPQQGYSLRVVRITDQLEAARPLDGNYFPLFEQRECLGDGKFRQMV